MKPSQNNILPTKKKKQWRKSWPCKVSQLNNKLGMEQEKHKGIRTAYYRLVFCSSQKQDWNKQYNLQKFSGGTMLITTVKSQTVKTFGQCVTANNKVNIVYGTKFFISQKLDLCEVHRLWLLWSRHFIKVVILLWSIWFFQTQAFRFQTKLETLFWKHLPLKHKIKLVSYLAKCWHKRCNFPIICSIHICSCLHKQLNHIIVTTISCQPQRCVSFLVTNIYMCSSKKRTSVTKWNKVWVMMEVRK